MRLLEDVFLNIEAPARLLFVPTQSYAAGTQDVLVDKRPMLEWNWGASDTDEWREDLVPHRSEVSYDLRVIDAYSGLIYYQKFGLDVPRHKLEKKLRKKRGYSWQIRATFRWNGRVRRTSWIGDFPVQVSR